MPGVASHHGLGRLPTIVVASTAGHYGAAAVSPRGPSTRGPGPWQLWRAGL